MNKQVDICLRDPGFSYHTAMYIPVQSEGMAVVLPDMDDEDMKAQVYRVGDGERDTTWLFDIEHKDALKAFLDIFMDDKKMLDIMVETSLLKG